MSSSEQFLSTPSGWRVTIAFSSFLHLQWEFLPTPSGWRATSTFRQYFSRCPRFLSTPSGWRATGHLGRGAPKRFYFYPRPPGGGRPQKTALFFICTRFLSTPSGWRATVMLVPRCTLQISFLSTPSGWRATVVHPHHDTSAGISIHALRVEGDIAGGEFPTLLSGISIHALRVEGDIKALITSPSPGPFLSTPSGWRATAKLAMFTFVSFDFYPRPPGGGRPTNTKTTQKHTHFYPRPPGGGRP